MSVALELNNFTFNSNEVIKDRCAEVFLTNQGRFILNCVNCYEMFHDYQLFKQHMREDHSGSDLIIPDEENTIESVDEFEDINVQTTEVINVDFVEEVKEEENVLTAEESVKKEDNELWTIIPDINFQTNDETNSQDEEFFPGNGFVHIFTDDVENLIEQDAEESDSKEFIEFDANIKKEPTAKRTSRIRKPAKPRIRPNNSNSERKHVCPICSFAFADKSNLNSHVKRHGNEKKHHCTECPKRFFSRTELETHMRWHTGERPYICSKCGKGCLTAGDLTVHERRHTNDRRYKCNYCEKGFFNNKHLKDHIVSHTQERNFECHICQSRFLRKKSLLSHIKIHENKREYVCNICGIAYNQKPALSIHIKAKHGVYLHKKEDST